MSSDLIAGVVALSLGFVVVVLGRRRNLDDVTQSWLPRFEGVPEKTTESPWVGSYGGARERRGLSPRQRRLAIGIYLLIVVLNATDAVLSAEDRLLHGITAGLVAIGVVMLVRQGRRSA